MLDAWRSLAIAGRPAAARQWQKPVAGGRASLLVIGPPARIGAERFNAATVLRDDATGWYHKTLLPNKQVSECRYFTPAPRRWW